MKIHQVLWDKVVAPKSEGDLNVGTIHTLNTGPLVKWWCWLKMDKGSLWVKAIKWIHNLNNKLHNYLSNRSTHEVWNIIATGRKDLKKYGSNLVDVFKLQIKFGFNTLFWSDWSLGSATVSGKYMSQYELKSRKKNVMWPKYFSMAPLRRTK